MPKLADSIETKGKPAAMRVKARRPNAVAPPVTEEPTGKEAPTDEEQDIFTRIELGALSMLYDDQTHEGIVNMLKQGAQQPAQTLASTALMVFGEIDKQSGGKVPEEQIIPALVEGVLGAVVDMAEKTGALPIDESIAGKAVQELLIMAGQQYDIDPAALQQAIESVPSDQQQQMVAQQQQFAEA